MQRNEKIGLAMIAVLIIILATSVFGQEKNTSPKIDCTVACFEFGKNKWTFPGDDPSYNLLTKEECLAACQAKFGR